jgi:TrmH family RNA methyltransferase
MERPIPIVKAMSHPRASLARDLARGVRERRSAGLFLLEGPRGLSEALDAGARPAFALIAAGRADRSPAREIAERCRGAGIPIELVQDALLERIAPSETPTGLLAACPLPAGCDDPARVLGAAEGLAVLAVRIQNPGSIGTLVRSAAAFGATGFVAAGGADPWGPKAVRASAGAIHRLPVARAEGAESDPALVDGLRRGGWRLVAAVPRGGLDPAEVDWSGRVALLLGAEVAGLPPELVERADAVTIPMAPGVESLSVPVAGSILLALAAGARRSR